MELQSMKHNKEQITEEMSNYFKIKALESIRNYINDLKNELHLWESALGSLSGNVETKKQTHLQLFQEYQENIDKNGNETSGISFLFNDDGSLLCNGNTWKFVNENLTEIKNLISNKWEDKKMVKELVKKHSPKIKLSEFRLSQPVFEKVYYQIEKEKLIDIPSIKNIKGFTHTGEFVVTPEGRFRPVVLEFVKKYFDRIEKMILSENTKEHLSDEAKYLANLAKNEGVYSKTIIYSDIYTAFGKVYDHLSGPLKKKIRSELKDKKIKPLSNFNQALKKCLDTKPYPKKNKKMPKKTGDNELDILMEIEEKYKDQDEEIRSKGWT